MTFLRFAGELKKYTSVHLFFPRLHGADCSFSSEQKRLDYVQQMVQASSLLVPGQHESMNTRCHILILFNNRDARLCRTRKATNAINKVSNPTGY